MKGKTRRNRVCFHLSQNMFFKNTKTRKKYCHLKIENMLMFQTLCLQLSDDNE